MLWASWVYSEMIWSLIVVFRSCFRMKLVRLEREVFKSLEVEFSSWIICSSKLSVVILFRGLRTKKERDTSPPKEKYSNINQSYPTAS